MYSKKYYRRKKFFSGVSNFIWRTIMTAITLAILGVIAYALLRWSGMIDFEIESHAYRP